MKHMPVPKGVLCKMCTKGVKDPMFSMIEGGVKRVTSQAAEAQARIRVVIGFSLRQAIEW